METNTLIWTLPHSYTHCPRCGYRKHSHWQRGENTTQGEGKFYQAIFDRYNLSRPGETFIYPNQNHHYQTSPGYGFNNVDPI